MKPFLSVLGLSLILAASARGAEVAQAADFQCNGIVTGGTYDNVVVPPGATCIMLGVTVQGNVTAKEDSNLFMRDFNVGGNIDVNKPAAFGSFQAGTVGGNVYIGKGGDPSHFAFDAFLCGATVGGNVTVEKMEGTIYMGDFPIAACPGNVIGGNLEVERNLEPPGASFSTFYVRNNTVAGNAKVSENKGPAAKTVQANLVQWTLSCIENDPPFIGGPNAASKTEGQCF